MLQLTKPLCLGSLGFRRLYTRLVLFPVDLFTACFFTGCLKTGWLFFPLTFFWVWLLSDGFLLDMLISGCFFPVAYIPGWHILGWPFSRWLFSGYLFPTPLSSSSHRWARIVTLGVHHAQFSFHWIPTTFRLWGTFSTSFVRREPPHQLYWHQHKKWP